MESKELALAAAHALAAKKGQDIRVLGIRELTVLGDYFVIGQGTSSTQVQSLADEVEYQLEQLGAQPTHIEGRDARNWVVLDYGSVIVHVFDPQARSYYDLERLWADAVPVAFDEADGEEK